MIKKKLSIVIPIYYNFDSLPLLLKKLNQLEGRLKSLMIVERIFVIDGCLDGSYEYLLKKKSKEDILINLKKNFGSQVAIKIGMEKSSGDCLCCLAADLQDPPELIYNMVVSFLKGHRFIIYQRSTRHDPFFSKILAFIYYKFVRYFVVNDYPKGGFDLFLIDRKMVLFLKKIPSLNHLSITIFNIGIKPLILSYDRKKRLHGKSKWTLKKKVTLFTDVLIGHTTFSIRFFILMGLLLACTSFLYFINIFFNFFLNGSIVPGFYTLVSLVSLIGGFLLILVGILGEYIVRIYTISSRINEPFIDDEI